MSSIRSRWQVPKGAPRISSGFTLIELLLAMVIFAVVLAAINTVFLGAMRLWQKTADSSQRALPEQQTLASLRRDLAGIVVPGGTFAGALNTSATIDGINQQDVGTEIFTTSGTLRTTQPWADIQRVAYVLRDSTNRTSAAGQDLVRVVRRNPLPALEAEAEEHWMMSGVERIDFSFYDGSNWRTSWNSTNETTLLPKAIRVEITVAQEISGPGRGRNANTSLTSLQLLVPVLVAASTNTTASAGSAGGAP
ncbi:MAG: prepilin-type N-terminal cleavage/methylation domain-containing protein [Pedosphaera sp.]|nr:prepilin-type N-terminal cleavage/methylation domain-containing protein [Pedosphaera sp.]